jgi:4-hydroxy-2-oxoglutarate aldolase
MTLTGVLAPVPTPFVGRLAVDVGRLRDAMARWMASPLDGIVVLGSSGEAPLLDDAEADLVVETARPLVPRTRRFIVGTGRESTRAAIRAARRAAELGADAVLVRTPGFFRSQMTPDVLIRHYRSVADASPVPVVLYNFTGVTGVNLLPATVASLATHPNIVGVKDSNGDMGQIAELVRQAPAGFSILTGSGSTFLDAVSAGVAGGILALACVAPEACRRVFDLARTGRLDEARTLQHAMGPLARLIGPVHGVAGLKAALALAGCDVGGPRAPLVPVGEDGIAALRDALALLHEVPA